jgi:hypothetical protein
METVYSTRITGNPTLENGSFVHTSVFPNTPLRYLVRQGVISVDVLQNGRVRKQVKVFIAKLKLMHDAATAWGVGSAMQRSF